MSSIFYKFRSTIDYKTYQFDGLHISGSDLKRAICSRESIRAESFDLILQVQIGKVSSACNKMLSLTHGFKFSPFPDTPLSPKFIKSSRMLTPSEPTRTMTWFLATHRSSSSECPGTMQRNCLKYSRFIKVILSWRAWLLIAQKERAYSIISSHLFKNWLRIRIESIIFRGVNAGIVTQNESAAGSSKGLDHISAVS